MCPASWAIVVVDEGRRVRYANASFRAALGLNYDIHGADVVHVVPRRWVTTVNTVLRRTGAGPPVTLESRAPNAEPHRLRFDAQPIAHTSLVILSVEGMASCPQQATLPARAAGDTTLAAQLLSPREREVLRLVADGVASKHIADQLGIALSTVETYRRQIMDKVQLRTVAELTKFAIRIGLTSP